MSNKKEDELGNPIFLDYDINNIPIKISQTEMLETIKEYFEKHGFEKTGKTDEGFIIFRKATNKEKRIL